MIEISLKDFQKLDLITTVDRRPRSLKKVFIVDNQDIKFTGYYRPDNDTLQVGKAIYRFIYIKI